MVLCAAAVHVYVYTTAAAAAAAAWFVRTSYVTQAAWGLIGFPACCCNQQIQEF